MDHTQVAPSTSVIPVSLSSVTLRIVAAMVGSLLVAICAHVSVPLLFTPVPLTLQTFAVLLIGLTLGPATAFAALTLYLIQGAAGFPVFSPHGPGGVLQLMGPTGGYLLSYPFAAAVTSLLARRIRPVSFTSYAFSAAMGSLLIFAVGASWFALVSQQSMGATLKMTVLPFLPGDALKICAAAAVAIGILKFRNKLNGPSASLHRGAAH
ncbi:MAG TPA: biotin transporter BioY [Silvibacterium sp.]|nr:biotin transporter BioY [Silvibacterium sp.]